jgi:hypothetical protein
MFHVPQPFSAFPLAVLDTLLRQIAGQKKIGVQSTGLRHSPISLIDPLCFVLLLSLWIPEV